MNFKKINIANITKKLDPDKAYGHNMVSISMLKIKDGSVSRHIQIMFRFCITDGVFPFE